ncbi:hypothetical protein YC2023_039907 [Brassica napus]
MENGENPRRLGRTLQHDWILQVKNPSRQERKRKIFFSFKSMVGGFYSSDIGLGIGILTQFKLAGMYHKLKYQRDSSHSKKKSFPLLIVEDSRRRLVAE